MFDRIHVLFTYFIFTSNKGFRARRVYTTIFTLRTSHSGGKFWKQNFFLHTSLNQFLFKICTSIRHMVLIFQQKRNSDFILKSFFFTKLESADSVVVISMISNIVGPGFSSTTFACLIHLHPEMQADEIQCTI